MLSYRREGFETLIAVSTESFKRYWPAAVICCAVQTPSIARALAAKRSGGDKVMLFLLGEALTAAAVVLLALVVTLGGTIDMESAGAANYVLMALLLFPWAVLWRSSSRAART